jgi:hypothetical protein
MLFIGPTAKLGDENIRILFTSELPFSKPLQKCGFSAGLNDEHFVALGYDINLSPRQKSEPISYILRDGNLALSGYFWHKPVLHKIWYYFIVIVIPNCRKVKGTNEGRY